MRKKSCGCYAHDGFVLSPEGLAQRELSLSGVAGMGPEPYLDKAGSVSGLGQGQDILELDDEMTDQQYRRFLDHG